MKPCQTNSSSQDFDSSFFVFDFFDFFDDISIHFMWSCSGGCGRFCHCAVASKTAAVTELSCSHNPLLSCHPGCWTVAVWGMVRHKVYKHIRFVVGDVFFCFRTSNLMLPKSEITRVEYCWINQWSSEPKSGIDRQKCQNYSRPFPAQVRPPPKCGWVRAGIPPKKSRSDSDFRNYLPRYIWWYWWWMMGVAPDVAYAEKKRFV